MEVNGLGTGVDSLESRILALRDRVRRQNLLLTVLLLAVLTLVLVAAKRTPSNSVVARAFVLVDQDGKTRAELAMATVLSNRPGVQQMRVPYLRLYDNEGGTGTEIMLGPDGSPKVSLSGSSLPTAIDLGVDNALGTAQLRLFHVRNQGQLRLELDSDGQPRILMRDAEGQVLDVKRFTRPMRQGDSALSYELAAAGSGQ